MREETRLLSLRFQKKCVSLRSIIATNEETIDTKNKKQLEAFANRSAGRWHIRGLPAAIQSRDELSRATASVPLDRLLPT